ncbi:MAG: response regulator transcription factor [Sphingosinicella sp.]
MSSQLVYVVDDDRDVRRSLSFLLGASGLQSHPFGSGEDFIAALPDLRPGCVLLDLRMPQMDGFDVMAELATREIDWPVILMTGHGDVPVAIRGMKSGAVDFIEKPFSEESLLACFGPAFQLLGQRVQVRRQQQGARDLIGRLSARETTVLRGILAGLSSKQIAQRLDISVRTTEMHRGNIMKRLGIGSLAEAITLGIAAGLQPLTDAA